MISGDRKEFPHVRKADRGVAGDTHQRSARMQNRLMDEVKERPDLGYSSSSSKRPSQLMPATRDELFTRLSNQ